VKVGPYSRAVLALVFIPLYAGPGLAGLSGHPPATIPVYAALFLAFIAATRRPDLTQGPGWATLTIMAVVQTVLTGAVFGIGALIAGAWGVMGALTLPVLLPIALTATAAAYGVWSYSNRAEMDVFLESTIEKLKAIESESPGGAEAFHPVPSRAVQRAVDETIAALTSLPEDAQVGEIDPIMQALEAKVGIEAFDPLYDAAGEIEGQQDRRVDLGLLRFAASPRITRALLARGEGGMAAMLLINAPDAAVRHEARKRIIELIDDGAPAVQLPDAVWLDELAVLYPGEGFRDLAKSRAALSKADKTG